MYDMDRISQREAAIKRNGTVLAKYLWILLLIQILRLVGTLMTSGLVNPISYVQFDLGHIIMAVTDVCFILCMLRLSEVSDRYKYVAWIHIGLALIKWVPTLAFGSESGYMSQYIALWLTYIMNCGAIYLELQAHIDALYRVDLVLSEKWHSLSMSFVGVYVAQFVCELLPSDVMLFNTIGRIGLLLIPWVLLVMNLLKLYYLYKTASLFRDAVAQ